MQFRPIMSQDELNAIISERVKRTREKTKRDTAKEILIPLLEHLSLLLEQYDRND